MPPTKTPRKALKASDKAVVFEHTDDTDFMDLHGFFLYMILFFELLLSIVIEYFAAYFGFCSEV